MLTVSALYIYPVKSLGGISVPSARLTHRGFAYDRRWMLVDEENRFITQREVPEMTLLQTRLHEDCLSISHRHTGDTLKIPFQPTGDICTVTVWNDTCQGQFVSPEADQWFSDRLSLPCRLVYMPETTLRKVDPNYAHGDEITSFSDGFPLLMIGQASLDDLNSRLSQPLVMERFRPNIVFTGGSPFLEDEMAAFSIADIRFYAVKPCARCVITTIDLLTGEKGKEPLRTLGSYRRHNNKLYFGQNLLFDRPPEVRNISVGDAITLLQKQPPAIAGTDNKPG
jgi:uncharacterized protein YcbX